MCFAGGNRGLKWDENGEVNYDTTMNVIGNGLLAGGTMCQPADNLLGEYTSNPAVCDVWT